MLKNISINLTPELYKILYDMGHGDELVICDANFPASTNARRLYRVPEVDSASMLDFILDYFPIDTFVSDPVVYMEVAEGDDYNPETWGEYDKIIAAHEGRYITPLKLGRSDFYARTKLAYAVILTGERRRYGNIIIKKGIL
ncbi:MAG TPA: fucose isomerase [Clostridiales bacterium]|nr:fucose isomerase [Clostridiales bacterium]